MLLKVAKIRGRAAPESLVHWPRLGHTNCARAPDCQNGAGLGGLSSCLGNWVHFAFSAARAGHLNRELQHIGIANLGGCRASTPFPSSMHAAACAVYVGCLEMLAPEGDGCRIPGDRIQFLRCRKPPFCEGWHILRIYFGWPVMVTSPRRSRRPDDCGCSRR